VELYSTGGGQEQPGTAESDEAEGWVKLVDPPAVPQDRFARACQKAGRYEQAVELYSKLIKKHPDRRHYQKMWFICRRLAGAKLEDITAEMSERDMDKPEKSWLEWARKVDHLSISLEEGGK
jgi:tetratricopeptide (TPR) repeat protein